MEELNMLRKINEGTAAEYIVVKPSEARGNLSKIIDAVMADCIVYIGRNAHEAKAMFLPFDTKKPAELVSVEQFRQHFAHYRRRVEHNDNVIINITRRGEGIMTLMNQEWQTPLPTNTNNAVFKHGEQAYRDRQLPSSCVLLRMKPSKGELNDWFQSTQNWMDGWSTAFAADMKLWR
jgi:antitoxin (DNA-binding transcriptional repressor) of toxin-antitoxin stability system